MKRLMTLATGGAIGYVAGARAGRERYDGMVRGARAMWRGWPKDADGRRSVNPKGLISTQLSTERVPVGSAGDRPAAGPNGHRSATETPVVDSALNELRRTADR